MLPRKTAAECKAAGKGKGLADLMTAMSGLMSGLMDGLSNLGGGDGGSSGSGGDLLDGVDLSGMSAQMDPIAQTIKTTIVCISLTMLHLYSIPHSVRTRY